MAASAARNHKFLVSKQWEVARNFAKTRCSATIDDETRCSLLDKPLRAAKNPFGRTNNHRGQYG